MNKMEDKVAIITGASSGIGRATARLFAQSGARLVLSARNAERLESVAVEIEGAGGTAVTVLGDVRQEYHAKELVDTALARFGRLDVGFNNAGIVGEMSEVQNMTVDDWKNTLDTNLTGAFFGAKYQIPAMTNHRSGSVIFSSSFVGHAVGFPGMTAYAASKAGLIGMTQCLAVEHGASGIRVNALLPGGTQTPMSGDFSDDPEAEETIASFHALKRMAKPEEIAQVALFLASDASTFVTGSAMLADGGNAITKVSGTG